ncbi:MAG: hypothetical protein ABI645_05485 [Pseudomonadota bacterium]
MKWRRWLLVGVLAAILLPLALALNRSAATGANPPPTSADVRTARRIFERVVFARQASKPRRIRFTWAELATGAAMSGRAAGEDRVSLVSETTRAHLQISHGLPWGFWLNVHAFVAPDKNGAPHIHARVGHLPLPAFVVHGAIALTAQLLRMRGVDVLPLRQMVKLLQLDARGMSAVLNLPANSRALRALAGVDDEIDPVRIEAHYCRLASVKRTGPVQLAGLVNQAFAASDATVSENRAIFIALALVVAQIDAGALPEGKSKLFKRCGKPPAEFQLQGRADLAKHWTVSAAITAYLGTDASLTLGTWKEISDSGAGGSGFSLVDLAADRSGVFSAERGTDELQARSLQNWLAQATEDSLLPVGALALAEGMTEGEFRARYTDTDSDTYAEALARIDSALQVLMH